jgi:cation:H+ antiporter
VLAVLKIIGDETVLQELVKGLSTPLLIVFIVASLFVLSKGADLLIDGVVSLARRTGIPRIIIGATIVSLGTTAPEAFVSVMAAWMGDPGLALGNGVGSIIADTGLIFGLSCVLVPMPVNRFVLNRTGWVQVGSATLLVVISVVTLASSDAGPVLGRGMGLLFLLLLAGYLFATYVWAKQGLAGLGEEHDTSEMIGLPKTWVMIVGGLVAVIAGARVLIPCAAEIANRLGVPEDVIAATMVAFGTSLPELMTAISAIRKGHPEITVGNIVGADVLNCLFVIGAAAVARPLQIPGNFYTFHFPAMLIILYSFRGFIFMNRSGRFRRWQGWWLLGIYVVYVVLQYVVNSG